MGKRYSAKILSGLTLFVLVLGTLVFAGQQNAAAIGTKYFDDGGAGQCDLWNKDATSAICGKANIRLYDGETQYVQQAETHLTAFFTTKTGTITITGGNFCNGNGGDLIADGAAETNPIPNGTPVTHFQVNDGGTVKDRYGYKYNNGNSNCGDSKSVSLSNLSPYKVKNTAGIKVPAFTPSGAPLYAANIVVLHKNVLPGWDGIANLYDVSISGAGAYKIAQDGNTSGYGVTTQQVDTSPANVTYKVRFGADCDIAAGSNFRLYYYDMDNGGGAGAQLNGQIHMYLFDADTGKKLDDWIPGSLANSTGSHPYTNAKPGQHYIWEIRNVYYNNTIQFSAPFDGVNYFLNCQSPPQAKVKPQVLNIAPATGAKLQAGGSANITVNLKNTTSVAGTISKSVEQVWYSNSSTGTAPGAGDQTIATLNRITSNTPIGANKTLPSNGAYPYTVNGLSATYKYLCANINAVSGDSTTSIVGRNPAPLCRPIVLTYQPYLTVYGGDSIAGAGPSADGTSCSEDDNAGFLSWNNDNSSNAGYAGAGDEFAVLALGDITSFASGLGSSLQPNRLSFANVGSDTTGNYGGQFGGVNNINCDYLSDIDPASLTTGNRTIGGVTLGDGSAPRVDYIKGDVLISGNVVYLYNNGQPADTGAGNWTSVMTIPSYKLVVIGNIFIAPNVKSLSGTYIAIPDQNRDDATDPTGIIETCAMNGASLNFDRLAAGAAGTGYFNTCKNQLTIYGSFVAQQVRFDRTFGDYSSATPADNYATSQAAEKFVYSPELWVRSTLGIGNTASYSGRPPVL